MAVRGNSNCVSKERRPAFETSWLPACDMIISVPNTAGDHHGQSYSFKILYANEGKS